MISIYKIKPAFQRLLAPLVDVLRRAGVSPNHLSFVAILWSLFLGYLFLQHEKYPIYLIVFAFGLLIRMALNAMDGLMARKYNLQSRAGEIINEIGDIISDLAIILPLIVLPTLSTSLVIAFAMLSIINEYAGLLGKALGGTRRYDGPMGKSDRALIIGLFCLGYYFWPQIELFSNYIFGACTILVILSSLIRLSKAGK